MNLRKVSATLTRPNDTTQYAIGDVVANSTTAPVAIAFAGVVRDHNGTNEIKKAFMIDSANQSTKGDFELWLFHTAPTMDNDNAAFTPTDAELLNLVAVITFAGADAVVGDATSGAGGNAVYFGKFKSTSSIVGTKASAKALHGVFVARNTYTPVAQEAFTFELFMD